MKVTVWVRLDIECKDPAEAFGAVDCVLDEGIFQDRINESDCAEVRSATSHAAPEVKQHPKVVPRERLAWKTVCSDGEGKPDWWCFETRQEARAFARELRSSGYHEVRVRFVPEAER